MPPPPQQAARKQPQSCRKGKKNNGGSGKKSSGPSTSQSSTGSMALTPSSEEKSAHLRNKLTKASDLEAKLSNLSITNTSVSEEKASKLRFQLCEILSDILLADPNFAMRKDVTGRLWRGCFYGRIGELRSRIGREKNRMKKRAAAAAKDGSKTKQPPVDAKAVKSLEQILKTFLDEAVVLYVYLVEKYEGMLSNTQLSQMSQLSAGSQDTKSGSKRVERRRQSSAGDAQQDTLAQKGVVVSLHRLFIHLGDLYRYTGKYDKAEDCYLKASKLAPGKGNPYNQLAVVAQLKDSPQPLTAVALYWYARSLLAAHEPFETSRANLARLFASNRAWLDQHREDDESGPPKHILSDARPAKKAALERERALKSSKIRKFLSLFVDTTWDLFRGVKTHPLEVSNAASAHRLIPLDEMRSKMMAVLDTFSTLLSSASFSDALLCKLVAVCAFSSLTSGNEGLLFESNNEKGSGNEDSSKAQLVAHSQALAFSFMLRFGATIAGQVEKAVVKIDQSHRSKSSSEQQYPKERQNSSGSSHKAKAAGSTIRLLVPLLLLCDFVSSVYRCGEDGGNRDNGDFRGLEDFSSIEGKSSPEETGVVQDLCFNSQVAFWKSIASLANVLNASPLFGSSSDAPVTQPKDYEALLDGFRGFVPFQTFVRAALSPAQSAGNAHCAEAKGGSAYVTPDQAVRSLSLLNISSDSLEDATSSKVLSSTSGNETGTEAKISRFSAFVELFTWPPKAAEGQSTHACFLRHDVETKSISLSMSEPLSVDARTSTVMSKVATVEPLVVADKDGKNKKENQKPLAERGGFEGEKMSDEGEDLIVYKPSESGGAALLVPGALLLGSKTGSPPKCVGVIDDETREKKTALPRETGGGFASPRMIADGDNFTGLHRPTFGDKQGTTVDGRITLDATMPTTEEAKEICPDVVLNGVGSRTASLPPLPQSMPSRPENAFPVAQPTQPPPGFIPSPGTPSQTMLGVTPSVSTREGPGVLRDGNTTGSGTARTAGATNRPSEDTIMADPARLRRPLPPPPGFANISTSQQADTPQAGTSTTSFQAMQLAPSQAGPPVQTPAHTSNPFVLPFVSSGSAPYSQPHNSPGALLSSDANTNQEHFGGIQPGRFQSGPSGAGVMNVGLRSSTNGQEKTKASRMNGIDMSSSFDVDSLFGKGDFGLDLSTTSAHRTDIPGTQSNATSRYFEAAPLQTANPFASMFAPSVVGNEWDRLPQQGIQSTLFCSELPRTSVGTRDTVDQSMEKTSGLTNKDHSSAMEMPPFEERNGCY